MEKYFRKFALAIIVDKEGNILIQEREGYSKAGEKYGLFGGGIEKDESENDALIREIFEELGVRPKYFHLWKTMEINIEGYGLGLFHYFIIPLNEIFSNITAKEGNILRIKITDFLSKTDIEKEDRAILEELSYDWDSIVEKYLRY